MMRILFFTVFIFFVLANCFAKSITPFEKNISGIELIVIGNSHGAIESSFGHLMIRLIGERGLDDRIVAFVAKIKNGDTGLSIIKKGITGEYKAEMYISNLRDTIYEYSVKEKRSITRYIIPTTNTERNALVNYINDVLSNKIQLEHYSFFDKNCSRLLLNMLKKANIIATQKIATNRPLYASEWIHSMYRSPYPKIEMTLPFPILEKFKVLISKNDEKIPVNKDYPTNTYSILTKNFSANEQLIILDQNQEIPTDIYFSIIDDLKNNDLITDEASIYNANSLESSLYEFCNNINCSDNILSLLNRSFSIKSIKYKISRLKTLYFGNKGKKNLSNDFDSIKYLYKSISNKK